MVDKLTAREMVIALYDGGIAATYVDSYYMLVDSGEVSESDTLLRFAEICDIKVGDK